MEPRADHHDRPSHLITLPSGRTITVQLVLGGTPDAPVAPFDPCAPERCPACEQPFVQPVDWSPAGEATWLLTLRCPACEHVGRAVLDDGQVERYDRLLDDGMDALAADLDRLVRAQLEAEVRRFAADLEDELLLPEDFAA